MLPLYHGFMVGEVHSLLALDFKLGHATCFDQWVSDEQRLERASVAEPAPLHICHSHWKNTGGCCPFGRGPQGETCI